MRSRGKAGTLTRPGWEVSGGRVTTARVNTVAGQCRLRWATGRRGAAGHSPATCSLGGATPRGTGTAGKWSTREQDDGEGQHEAGRELHKVAADARCRGGNCGESAAASGRSRGETAHRPAAGAGPTRGRQVTGPPGNGTAGRAAEGTPPGLPPATPPSGQPGSPSLRPGRDFADRSGRPLAPLLFCSEPRTGDGRAPAPGLRRPRAPGTGSRPSATPPPRPSAPRGAAATCSAAAPRRTDDALCPRPPLARQRGASGPGQGAGRGDPGRPGRDAGHAGDAGRRPGQVAEPPRAEQRRAPRPDPPAPRAAPPPPTAGPLAPPHPAALGAPPAPLTPRRDEPLPPAARRTKRRGVPPPPPAEQRGPGPPRPAPPAGTHLRARREPSRFPPSLRRSRPPSLTRGRGGERGTRSPGPLRSGRGVRVSSAPRGQRRLSRPWLWGAGPGRPPAAGFPRC